MSGGFGGGGNFPPPASGPFFGGGGGGGGGGGAPLPPQGTTTWLGGGGGFAAGPPSSAATSSSSSSASFFGNANAATTNPFGGAATGGTATTNPATTASSSSFFAPQQQQFGGGGRGGGGGMAIGQPSPPPIFGAAHAATTTTTGFSSSGGGGSGTTGGFGGGGGGGGWGGLFGGGGGGATAAMGSSGSNSTMSFGSSPPPPPSGGGFGAGGGGGGFGGSTATPFGIGGGGGPFAASSSSSVPFFSSSAASSSSPFGSTHAMQQQQQQQQSAIHPAPSFSGSSSSFPVSTVGGGGGSGGAAGLGGFAPPASSFLPFGTTGASAPNPFGGTSNPFGTSSSSTTQPPPMFASNLGTPTTAPPFGNGAPPFGGGGGIGFGTAFPPAPSTVSFPATPFPSASTAATASGGLGVGSSNSMAASTLNPSAPPFTPFGTTAPTSTSPMFATSASTITASTSTTPSASSTFKSPFGGGNSNAWTNPQQGSMGDDEDDSDMTMMMMNHPGAASSGGPFQRGATRPLHTPFPAGTSAAASSSSSSLPFRGDDATGPASGFGASRATGFAAAPFGDGGAPTAPTPYPASRDGAGGDDQKRLEQLKAKLAEKKKRLLEKQREAQARGGASPPRTAATDDDDDDDNTNNFSSAPPIPSQRSGFPSRHDLVARNELRFGPTNAAASSTSNQTSRKPFSSAASSSSSNVPMAAASTSQVAPTEREDLSSAVSLVGTCMFMCPEEELDRRQRESDIQLLEIPNHSIYPSHYTIRDTVVKRFRRSAADYKLDVPEWVRPADVLEVVCGYLEEWVMERDRQGPDPRFPQNGTPPSLDVYQFVWDRTRMIRKDFTLQNYVGTGGKCDARAVRCHERIARWHAMCEHQLSHIPDFVKAQSQQNIQELGQTMKTLNQYYDDSLNRATVEVPDDNGNETRRNLDGTSHGCTFDAIQGKNPVDYDGTVLDNEPNSSSVENRLVGERSVSSPNHGTAEPEMRGLYILLTIDNDGGMEVLKYAAHLFQRRPHVYNSKPVQLALSIYKAKREHNYAKFFSLLRHRDTPYLFACIMFKHVELMRKSAFRIMSKTYGAKSKETNETIHDAFPLKNLARLLCFETIEEARTACQHYSITVKPMKVRSSSGTSIEEIIFWRESSFLEPKDEDKGTLIPLPPQKMIRIIEGKLYGATRLAVCRGQVSGPGACLSSHESSTGGTVLAIPSSTVSSLSDSQPGSQHQRSHEAVTEDAKFEAILKRQRELLQKQSDAESERIKQEAARQHEEENANARRKKEEELALKKAEEARRKQDEEIRLKHEEELSRRREEEEKRLAVQKAQKLEQERIEREREMNERKARAEELRIEQLRVEAERKRKEAEAEQQEMKRKAEEAARQRQQELEKMIRIRQMEKEEEERRILEMESRKKAKLADEKRKQDEEESRRREELKRELEAQRVKEQEEERAWAAETENARKSLLWGVWKSKYPPQPSINRSSLRPPVRTSSQLAQCFKRQAAETAKRATQPLSLSQVIRKLLRTDCSTSLAHLLAERTSPTAYATVQPYPPILLNVVVFIPMPPNSNIQICELVASWISLHIGIGSVSGAKGPGRTIRVAVVDCSGPTERDVVADVALVVMTPPWSDASACSEAAQEYLRATTSKLDRSVPTVILSIREKPSSEDVGLASDVASYYDESLVVSHESVEEETLDDAMQYAARALVEALEGVVKKNDFVTMDRFSMTKLGLMALRSTIWRDPDLASEGRNSSMFQHAQLSFVCCVEVLNEYSRKAFTSDEMTSPWPSRVFATRHGLVEDYFEDGIPLPVHWKALLSEDNVKPRLEELCSLLTGSLAEVIYGLLSDAPFSELQASDSFLEERRYKECLHHALLHCESQVQFDGPCVYLPQSMVQKLLDSMADRFEAIVMSDRHQQHSRMASPARSAPADDDFIGPIDLPPDDDDRQDNSSFVESQKTTSDSSKFITTMLEDTATNAESKTDLVTAALPVEEEKQDESCFFRPVSSSTKRERPDAEAAGGSHPGGSRQPKGGAAKARTKRPRRSVRESREYTRWLQNLERGDPIDMMVGNVPLSILLDEVPTLVDDLAARSNLSSKKE